MKAVIKDVPTEFIEFDDGTLIEFDTLIEDIDKIRTLDFTDFDLSDNYHKLLYDLLNEFLKCYDPNYSLQKYWKKSDGMYYILDYNNMYEIFNKLFTFLYDLVNSEEEE